MLRSRARTRGRFPAVESEYSVLGKTPGLIADFENEFYRPNFGANRFSDLITHSRTSNATMVDSDGLIKWGPHNLLTYSEEFDNAAWTQTGTVSITANVTTAPDGTETADRVVTSGSSAVTQGVIQELNHTIKIWVKAVTVGTNNTFRIQGTGGQLSADLTATGEWQLFSFTPTTLGTNSNWGLNRDSSNNAMDLYVWGAHLYRSDLGGMVNNPDRGDSYVPTTSSAVYLPRRGHHVYNGYEWVNEGVLAESEARTNLVAYSQDFTDATWLKSKTDTLAIDAVGPDGQTSAVTLVDDGATGTGEVFIYANVTVSTSTVYTVSVYAKADQLSYMAFQLNGFTTPITDTNAWFNLTAGSVGTVEAGFDGGATIEDVGNGWYRCSAAFTTDATDTSGQILILVADADNDKVVDRDGTSSILIYGAQLEAASTPSSYIPTNGSSVTRAAETFTIPSANLPWPTPTYIGDELVTNGTFDTDTSGWSVEGEAIVSLSNNAILVEGSSNPVNGGIAQQLTGTVSGKVYQVTFDLVAETGSGLAYIRQSSNASLGGGTDIFAEASLNSGTHSTAFVASQDNVYLIFYTYQSSGGARSFTLDNISVREINPLSVSIAMDGRQTGDSYTLARWYDDADNSILLQSGSNDFTFTQEEGGTVDSVTGGSFTSGVLVSFNVASRNGSTFINGAIDGVSLTENTTPTALADLSATDLSLGYSYNGTIRTLKIWPTDIGNSGLVAATAPSLEPSLNLSFDSTNSSYVDLGWSE